MLLPSSKQQTGLKAIPNWEIVQNINDTKIHFSFSGERDLAEVPFPAPHVQGSPQAAAAALPGSAAHSGRGSPSPSQFRAELREGVPPGDVDFGGKFKFKLQEVHGELREGPQERAAEL